MRIKLNSLYQILGVSQSATKEEIQKAFRTLAKIYHPDLNPDNVEIEKKFKAINEAYEILKDEEKRKKYDAELSVTAQKHEKNSREMPPEKPFDINDIGGSFESFFGFDAKTGNITNEDKLKKKNPLDTSELFGKFMGFK